MGRVDGVLVLGGTSDIGLAIARRLVDDRGARRLVLAGRDPAALAAAGRTFEPPTDVATEVFDARDPADHARFVDGLWERHGDIDVVVVAFGDLGGSEAQVDVDAVRAVAEVNYVGAATLATAVAGHLERQGHGALVVLSSMAAVRPRRQNYPYGSAKAGLDALARGIGLRLAESGGHVLVVRPGFVHTKMTAGLRPLPLATDPAAVAARVLHGLDRGRRVVYAPAALGPLATLIRLVPTRVWQRLRR